MSVENPGPDPLETSVELLERSEQLGFLSDSLTAVSSTGRGQLVLLRGEAGVGKTAVVRRFCAAQGSQGRMLLGACEALFAPRALGPFVDVAQAVGELVITYTDGTITNSVAGTTLNPITPSPGTTQPDGFNDVEQAGTIGFASGSQVSVADVSVRGDGSPDFSTRFAAGSNPFDAGDSTAHGLVVPGVVPADNVAHDVMLPIANPAPLLRKEFDLSGARVTRARLQSPAEAGRR